MLPKEIMRPNPTTTDETAAEQTDDALPTIRLRGVGKAYGNHFVLKDIGLEIEKGEFVVIVGRSGSGKSTLLNLIGGLDRPSAGLSLIHI